MSKVSKKVIITLKIYLKIWSQENTLIVSADIENQINELDDSEKKDIWK